jgi:hypothetical protein
MFGVIKKIILWNYERGTWPYDILCLLIIAFIFLTPNEWFRRTEKSATNSVVVVVKASEIDKTRLEAGVREITGSPDAKIVSVKERADRFGQKILEIEVDQDSGSK